MPRFKEIQDHYKFTDHEVETLKRLLPIMEPHFDRMIYQLHNFVIQFPEAEQFVHDESKTARLRMMQHDWLLGLFRGEYGETYFRRLQHIRNVHLFMGLPVSFVQGALNFLHLQMSQLIESQVEPQLKEASYLVLEKILDLNRDILAHTTQSIDELQTNLYYRMEHSLVRFTRHLIFAFDLLLLIGLIGLSLGAVYLIGSDISKIFHADDHGKSVLAVLGSLLVLWMIIELMEAEVDRIRGGAFKLHLFVGAAMVAFIRKILVASISFESFQAEVFYLASILVLGLIFWLISRDKIGEKRTLPRLSRL